MSAPYRRFSAARTAKREAVLNEQERNLKIKTAAQEREKIIDEILGWDCVGTPSDDIKRDRLIAGLPLLLAEPDLDDRRRKLQILLMNGWSAIGDEHYLKPVVKDAVHMLANAAKQTRDDVASLIRLFFGTHAMSIAGKKLVLEEIAALSASATAFGADARHDLETWLPEWRGLLERHEARSADARAQPSSVATGAVAAHALVSVKV